MATTTTTSRMGNFYDRKFAASELRKYRLKGRFRRLVD
jgi:hypothetical protein